MSKKQREAHERRRQAATRPLASLDAAYAPLLPEAQQAYGQGDLATAERFLRQLLASLSDSAEALHLLGVILYRTRRFDEAVTHMGRAVALNPGNGSFRSNFGLLLQAQDQLEPAADQFRHALRLNPRHPEAHNNLGNILQLQNRLEEAALHYREALRLKPDYPDAHTNLGAVAKAQGRIDDALAHYRQALALKPTHATAHYNLGNALTEEGDFSDATAAYHQAIAADPASAKAHYNLGNALSAQDKDEEALAEYRHALELDPQSVGAHTNIGVTRQGEGRLEEAIACYRAALAIDPHEAKAHLNLGMAHLIRGELTDGWPHYEWRHQAVPESAPAVFPQPRWGGPLVDPLAGRRILLQPEQGLGDTLEFLRYAPMVQAAGGHVILQVQPPLLRLTQEMARGTGMEVVSTADTPPPFDLRCPMLSLPLAFATTMEILPANIPYLRAPAEELRTALALFWPTDRLRVGLVWGGNPHQGRDRFRSMPLTALEPVLRVEGVHFYSLQVGPPATQLAPLQQQGLPLTDLGPHLHTMADTAAMIAQLDLVLTVCTSVSHLAGALGAPTWVMLAHVADWRWFLDREDCPWYPTARLFRQPTRGDWQSVAERVATALTLLRDQTLSPHSLPQQEAVTA